MGFGNGIKAHANRFEDMLAKHGRDVLWQESNRCSCFNVDSGQPRYDCKACGGTGFVYELPIAGRPAIQNVMTNKDYLAYTGMFEVGDILMTVPANMMQRKSDGSFNPAIREPVHMYNIGFGDIVTLIDDEVKTSEVLIRGEPLNNRPADTLLNPKVTRVLSIRMHDPLTGATTLYDSDDYTVAGAEIEWFGDAGPPEGSQYTVTYMHRSVYTVYAVLPRPRHQDGQELPRTVVLRYYPGGVLHESIIHRDSATGV